MNHTTRLSALLAFTLWSASVSAAPKFILISLDGATPRLVDQYLASGVLNPNEGLGLLQSKGFSAPINQTVSPSLTAVGHIAIATGSKAAKNDVVANTFHLLASPFTFNVSGFGAPIGGYLIDGPAETPSPTAEPIWLRLGLAGKKVVTATWPGGDGVDVRVPGAVNNAVVQPASERTVNYTVPFGAGTAPFQKGFSLTAASFGAAPQTTVDQLNAAGHPSYGAVLQANLETFTSVGASYDIKVAALDTTDDSVVNYDMLVFFNQAQGIQPGPFALPSAGPAYIKPSAKISALFYLEGHPNKAGVRYFVSQLAPDLSTVRMARSTVSFIPRNLPVLGDVDDINNHVGFWQPQADFRIVERIDAVPSTFASFPDLELEAIYEELVREFTDYQTRLALRAIDKNPDADLVMIYFEQPDGSCHQFLLTDSRQPTDFTNPNSIGAGQDAAKVARYAQYVQTAYQAANHAVQRIIESVGVDASGKPKSNVIVVSDHGFEIFHTAVNLTALLNAKGIPSSKVRAVTSGPAVNIYIALQGREPNGTVSRSEFITLQQQVIDALQSLVDTNPTYTLGAPPVSVFDQIIGRPLPSDINDPSFGRSTSEFIGQDSGDVYAILRVGYNFDGVQGNGVIRAGDAAAATPVLSLPNFYGAHGYDPLLPNLSSIFYAAGPDVGRGVLPLARAIDVAPTIAEMLGVETFAQVDGEPLPIGPLKLENAVSRKRHGLAGEFDLTLPVSGTLGVEGRKAKVVRDGDDVIEDEADDEGDDDEGDSDDAGGGPRAKHTIVFKFNKSLVNGGATVYAGRGEIVSAAVIGGNLEINLGHVADAQRLTLLLNGTDIYGGSVLTQFTFGVLRGDVDGNGIVNQTDIKLVSAMPRNTPVTRANFRLDVSVNGKINQSDVAQVRARAGHHLP